MNESGFTVGMIKVGEKPVIEMTITGTLHDEDYKIMVPVLEKLIKSFPKNQVDVIVNAINLKGWDLSAAWDDMKFGLDHGRDFSKIAFVGNKKWQKLAIKVGNWFMHGSMKYFEDFAEVKHWIQG